MRRRAFLAALGGAAALPLAAHAQERVRRIGVLMSGSETDPEQQARWHGLRETLEQLGWVERRNIHIDLRFAGRPERFKPLAQEMVATHPDVIFVQSTGFVAEVARQTRTIPVIFANVSDPIGAGFVATLPRPGGNLTGLVLLEASVAGKWLAMLKEIAPAIKRVALVGNPKTSPYDYFLRAVEAAAPALGIKVLASRVETAADIENSFESLAREPDGGLIVAPDATMTRNRGHLVTNAARHRLPTVYPEKFYVMEGGLMSYGIANLIDQFRQAATYVDRILRGETASDLPVQGPTKYSTLVNLKTAKALGLTVPAGLLVAADEVIE
jgi:putative ABC transport system substrate-binding protein